MSAPRNIQIVWTRAARIRHALNQDFGGQWEKKFLKMKLFLPLAFLDLQDRHSHNVWHLFFCNNEALLKTRFAKGIIYSCTTRKLENGKPQGKITISRQSHQK